MLNILLKNKGIYFSWKNREIQFHFSTNIPPSSSISQNWRYNKNQLQRSSRSWSRLYIYIVRWSGNTVYYSRSVTRNTVNRAPHDSQRRNDSPRNESRGISRRQAEKKRQVSRCKQARHMDDRWKWITILAPARKHAFLAVSKNRTTDD